MYDVRVIYTSSRELEYMFVVKSVVNNIVTPPVLCEIINRVARTMIGKSRRSRNKRPFVIIMITTIILRDIDVRIGI